MKHLLTLCIALVISASGNAQIPNSSFENWNNQSTHIEPENWGAISNFLANLMGDTTVFIAPSNQSQSGQKSAYMQTKMISMMGQQIVYPAIMFAQFPSNEKPSYFSGWFKWNIQPGDSAVISVSATNSGQSIALGNYFVKGIQANWTKIEFNITDEYPSLNPDTVIVQLMTSSGDNPNYLGSFLYADNLNIMSQTSVSIKPTAYKSEKISAAYPNPSNERFNFKINDMKGTLDAKVYDITGKLIYQTSITGENTFDLNLGSFNKGLYFIQFSNESGVINTQKLNLK